MNQSPTPNQWTNTALTVLGPPLLHTAIFSLVSICSYHLWCSPHLLPTYCLIFTEYFTHLALCLMHTFILYSRMKWCDIKVGCVKKANKANKCLLAHIEDIFPYRCLFDMIDVMFLPKFPPWWSSLTKRPPPHHTFIPQAFHFSAVARQALQ